MEKTEIQPRALLAPLSATTTKAQYRVGQRVLLSINFGLVIPPARLEGSNATYSFQLKTLGTNFSTRRDSLSYCLFLFLLIVSIVTVNILL